MISKEQLKQKLLDSSTFIDNNFLNQYIELIITNLNNLLIKNETQKHHILPQYYFVHRDLPIDNSKDNLVNLSITNHIKAHYYLYNCVNDDKERFSNLFALNRMLGGKFTDLSTIESLNDNDCIALYKDYIEGNRQAHLGKTHKASDETKIKIGNANRGKYHNYKYIHNDAGDEKRIPENELQDYLENGWVLGRSSKTILSLKNNYNYNSKGMLGKKQTNNQKVKVSQALLGRAKSEQAKSNMLKAKLGKKVYINPNTGKGKYLNSEEIEQYSKLGWYPKSKKFNN